MNKILSIIVPSYNMEAYLPKCLGSLVIDDKELLQKLDVIVVNDGSKDRTSEIAHDFEAKHPGVFRVIDKTNGHYGSCINAALPVAAGTFVKVLDADDWFVTENFCGFLALVDAECRKGANGADLILSGWEEGGGDSDGNATAFSYTYLIGEDKTIADIEFPDAHQNHRFEMFAVTYRTTILRDIKYRQPEGIIHTDKIWINLPMAHVHSFTVFDKVVYHYFSGRPGNTCNEEAFYRTYHVQMDMLKRMILEFNGVCADLPAPNAAFMRKHIRYRTFRAYWLNIIERHPLLAMCDLKGFDDFLHENAPWLYEEMGHLRISRRFPYRFICDWRKRQRVSCSLKLRLGMALGLLRAYSRIRKSFS